MCAWERGIPGGNVPVEDASNSAGVIPGLLMQPPKLLAYGSHAMAASSGVYVVASDGALTVFESIFVEYLVRRPERSHRRVLSTRAVDHRASIAENGGEATHHRANHENPVNYALVFSTMEYHWPDLSHSWAAHHNTSRLVAFQYPTTPSARGALALESNSGVPLLTNERVWTAPRGGVGDLRKRSETNTACPVGFMEVSRSIRTSDCRDYLSAGVIVAIKKDRDVTLEFDLLDAVAERVIR